MKERKKYYTEVDDIEVFLFDENVKNICHPGPNDADVEEALADEEIARQFDKFSTETLREVVAEIGVGEKDASKMSRETLISYVVWDAAYDLLDDNDSEWHKDQKAA